METYYNIPTTYHDTGKKLLSFSTICYILLGFLFIASLSVLSSSKAKGGSLSKRSQYISLLPSVIHPTVHRKVLENPGNEKLSSSSDIQLPDYNQLLKAVAPFKF